MKKKIWCQPVAEDWIVDRIIDEWNAGNPNTRANSMVEADIIWLAGAWVWQHVPLQILREKKVVATIHHIVHEKFTQEKYDEFRARDQFVDAYTVPNFRTQALVQSMTEKRVELCTYWANQNIWRKTGPKEAFRDFYRIPRGDFVIGSFVRDGEGSNPALPKLEKAPDLFIKAVERYMSWMPNVHVLLGGWRRQYVINELDRIGARYTYIERPPQETLNEMYQCCDLVPVCSRYEGGPQSLLECGLLGIPVVSRPVGIAELVLPASAIADDVTEARASVPCVKGLTLPQGFAAFNQLFVSL